MAIRAYGIGKSVTNVAGEVKCLATSIGTTAHYMTFEEATVDYFVPAGKTLYITKLIIYGDAAASGIALLGYANDGVASGAPAPTTPIAMIYQMSIGVADYTVAFDVFIPIPVGKYPFMQSLGLSRVTAYGIEV